MNSSQATDTSKTKHPKEFNWAIQGQLSHRDCKTQPGTHPWFIENAGISWFMGCRKQTIAPDAPPPSAEILALIAQFTAAHSTSEWKRFEHLRQAAMYAADRLEKCSHYYECSGYIVLDPSKKFVVSPVRTDYNSDSVRVDDEDAPSDWKVVADFHSHPCVPHHYTELFSGEDMMGAILGRKIAYMVDLCSGNVHEFLPGIDKPDMVPVHDGTEWLSAGTIIGHVAAFKDDATANEGL